MPRRDRQRAELVDLCVAGPIARAIDLAHGHLAEFGPDDDLLDDMRTAFERRGMSTSERRRLGELLGKCRSAAPD